MSCSYDHCNVGCVLFNNTVLSCYRSLANFGRPLSDTTLEVKGELHPQGTERQLTYEEIGPTPDDPLTNQISASAPDSFYDLAKPEEGTFVDQQLYMDIEAIKSENGKPTYSIKSAPPPDSTHSNGPTAVYDDVEFVAASTQEKPDDPPQELYEEVNPELSIKDQPLPPLPIDSVTTATTSQPIYEDIGTEQPVYESVDPSLEGSKVGMERETVRDVEFGESVNCALPPKNGGAPPPLPPKDDLPPLPPRDNSPPLPPKDDSPPLPPKDDTPVLPPKDDSTVQPPKDNLPVLPPKEDTPLKDSPKNGLPLLTLRDELPPLPPKEDLQDNYYDDVTTALESENLQLSDIARQNVTPPSPRRVDKNGTPPSPHRVDRPVVTPPSPHRVDNTQRNGTPPSPRQVTNSPTHQNKRARKPSPTPRRKVPMATSPVENKPRAKTTVSPPPTRDGEVKGQYVSYTNVMY